MSTINETPRATPVWGSYDVVVCGAGPAGIGAALAAARAGARTLLIEAQGQLGGVWTSGLLSLILDAENKDGIMAELLDRLRADGAARGFLYDAEAMKWHLETMCVEAGVELLLHTRLAHAVCEGRRLTHGVVENKSGRGAIEAAFWIDASGDGDLAARAGCDFEVGRPADGLMQPMTMMGIVKGVPQNARDDDAIQQVFLPKARFLSLIHNAGIEPSYAKPSLFELPGGLFCLMVNHVYERSALCAADVTAATLEGRGEVNRIVRALRERASGWKELHLVATAQHIGTREGRRVRGDYYLQADDLARGARFDDAVCRATFCVDVHAPTRAEGGGYGAAGVSSRPYDIPFRSLIAGDLDNLLLCGRCISGDFYAHASYRVSGNATATGEAAGIAAAHCLRHELELREYQVPA